MAPVQLDSHIWTNVAANEQLYYFVLQDEDAWHLSRVGTCQTSKAAGGNKKQNWHLSLLSGYVINGEQSAATPAAGSGSGT